MDAPSKTPERSAELAALRRRAYGPDADIQRDPDALRRLHELEEAARLDAASIPPSAAEPADPAPLDASEAAEAGVARADPAPPDATADAPPATRDAAADSTPSGGSAPPSDTAARDGVASTGETHRSPARTRWWRRIPVWAIAVACLAVGAVVGGSIAATWTGGPRADETLRIASAGVERGEGWEQMLSAWGMNPASTVPYESFRGIDVWTGTSDQGSRCVLLANDEMLLGAACSAGDLDPTLDFTVYAGGPIAFDESLPEGTVIRFVARQSSVDVWVRPPAGSDGDAAPQSLSTSWRDVVPSAP